MHVRCAEQLQTALSSQVSVSSQLTGPYSMVPCFQREREQGTELISSGCWENRTNQHEPTKTATNQAAWRRFDVTERIRRALRVGSE